MNRHDPVRSSRFEVYRTKDSPDTPIGKDLTDSCTVKRRTIRKRMRGKLQEIKQQLRKRMHDPVPDTGEWLKSVVRGYFNYYAVPGNLDTLKVFRARVSRSWQQALLRRSQKHRLTATRMYALEARWLPVPHVLHPYPEQRFAANHIRDKSRMR